ncbi:hypothetical protein [Streptomyces pinistramenti]|uniref:hypothetical protein n=1 Tax=Streptomyces pinistramenti TaxID=2884812 RepID=UPI001D07AF49|nr:hypothetical protein [Streptomyces pinistramenti]MCB5907607.1 hypothetical protein [Streptomyces pinistramenti]
MWDKLERKIVEALESGGCGAFAGGFAVDRTGTNSGEAAGYVPRARRPEVLVGHGGACAPLVRLGSVLFGILTNDVPALAPTKATDDLAVRKQRQAGNGAFFGTWDSLAGQWLAAGQPHSASGVTTAVALAGDRMRFVYVQSRRVSGKLGDAVELGAEFPRAALSWTRLRDSSKDVQFGFADGSWGTLLVPDMDDFLEHFPETLSRKEPIP